MRQVIIWMVHAEVILDFCGKRLPAFVGYLQDHNLPPFYTQNISQWHQ